MLWKYRFSSFKALPAIHSQSSTAAPTRIPSHWVVEVGATGRRLGPAPILVRESKKHGDGNIMLAMGVEDGVADAEDRSAGGRALLSEDARNSFSVAFLFPSFRRYFLSAG